MVEGRGFSVLSLLALAFAGCGESQGGIDVASFEACEDKMLDGLSPVEAYDGYELRERCTRPSWGGDTDAAAPSGGFWVVESYGASCSESTCRDEVADLDARLAPLPAPTGDPYCKRYLVGMNADSVALVVTKAEDLLELLGTIDTRDEAQLYATFQGTRCQGMRERGSSYDILRETTTGECPVYRRLEVVRIGPNGSFEVVERDPSLNTGSCF